MEFARQSFGFWNFFQKDYEVTMDILAQLKQLPFWEHLTSAQQIQLKENARFVHYEAGRTIHGDSANCTGVLLIQSGILRTYLLSEDGKEVTIYRLRDGDTCMMSASCMLSAITFDVQIDAETDCDMLLIPTGTYAELAKQNIYVENYSYRLTTERFSDVMAAVQQMFFMTLEQRLAAFLIDESLYSHSNELNLTHEQIARAIGSAREVVSRTLKSLASAGYIEVYRGGVRILDKNGLYGVF